MCVYVCVRARTERGGEGGVVGAPVKALALRTVIKQAPFEQVQRTPLQRSAFCKVLRACVNTPKPLCALANCLAVHAP